MSRSSRVPLPTINDTIEVKSKFDAEFRRFSLSRSAPHRVDNLNSLLTRLHCLTDIPYVITYTDPIHGDLLPINNDDNYTRALSSVKHLLRIIVQRKGECYGEINGYGTLQNQRKKNAITKFIASETPVRHRVQIGIPEDFRRVSAIIDVDIVPETHRRVKLMKNGSDKPLGFYIRDGTSVHMTTAGLEKVPGIFISRLVPGGLAESTGLLAVNDEVLEVNGIDVAGKTLDQVTDMMVANSSNLIITVKPVNQKLTLSHRGTSGRSSQMSKISQASTGSLQSHRSIRSTESDTVIEHKEVEEESVQEGEKQEEAAAGGGDDEIELDEEEEEDDEEDDEDEVVEANDDGEIEEKILLEEKQTLLSVSTEDEPLLTL